MIKKLWEKNWKLDAAIESFETKDDLVLDQMLVVQDVAGSLAHVKMLKKIGILTRQEEEAAVNGLLEVNELAQKGQFLLQAGDEDVHTKIENYVTEKYGQVGKKIHTGRSRNDQVLTDIRLFTKEQMLSIWEGLLALAGGFSAFSHTYEFLPMPGYTHMQKAMPSSVGMWAGSFTEALLDDLYVFKAAYEANNKSPLGSAAGYGVPLPLDREYAAGLLGFAGVMVNPLYCQNSRGKIEAVVLSALCSILMEINKFATDILLFTTSEFCFFTVAPQLCSGSSIMPQKKNVDVAELLRSKIHLVLGHYAQIVSLSSNLPSGFNRDLQDSKKPLIESLFVAGDCLRVALILLSHITPNEQNLKKALTPEIFATHKALELVSKGTAFRQAYQQVGQDLPSLKAAAEGVLEKSTHTGGTGNLGLSCYKKTLQAEKQIFEHEKQEYETAMRKLFMQEGGLI